MLMIVLLALIVAVFSNATVDPNVALAANDQLEGKVFCSVCSLIMMIIEDAIDFSMTREQLVAWVSGLCNSFPSSLQSVCRNFIGKEVNKIVDLLLEKYPADKICASIGACDSVSITEDELHEIEVMLDEFMAQKQMEIEIPEEVYDEITEEDIDFLYENGYAPLGRDSLLCDVCKTVVQHVLDYIDDPHNKNAVEEVLRKACNFLSGTLKNICVNFINKEYEKLISLIIQGLPARDVCVNLNICNLP